MKPIKNYEGFYSIDINGNVFSHHSNRVIKQRIDKDGYCVIPLSVKGVVKHRKIHRLVAQTYIPNPMNKPQVNHIDCDKTNNNINNLEWCTNRENVIHAMKNGMIAKNNGEFSGTSKLKEKDIIKIRKLHKDGMTQQNISKLFPVKREAIGKILRGERWAHVK